MYTIPQFPADMPTDPAIFLSSTAGTQWAEKLARSYPHTSYSRGRSDTFSLAQCDEYASAIIQAKRSGENPETKLASVIHPCRLRETWHYDLRSDLAGALREQFDDRDLEEEWEESVYPVWKDAAASHDDSSATDLFASYDYCQILFRFANKRYVEDSLIHSNKPWPDFAHLTVDENLQFALNNLGFTVGQYRKASGNKDRAYSPLKSTRPRRDPIITNEQLEELVENACSTYFHFYLFAIVPITDVIELDPNAPIKFSKAWVASSNCINGTFHDVPANGPVTVNPTDGLLISGFDMAYSPDHVCCLHTPHYHARLRN